jgi:H+/Cl- antiporter ClcA
MAPLILLTTVMTHLFGGSAGREGTAVQMGGAWAAAVSRRMRLDRTVTQLALMAGISGGFAGVFGTPVAGTIFGMEVMALGTLQWTGIVPCAVAAFAAKYTVDLTGVTHAHYAVASGIPAFNPGILGKVLVAAIAFGMAAAAFSEMTVLIEGWSKRFLPETRVRTAVGGVVVIACTLALGTRLYNGLSLPLLATATHGADVPSFAFAAKLALTAITLGFGFKGGEVTPLFVIGATLGSSMAHLTLAPPDFLAALGFVAVFAAAANTPLACIAMGAELFGMSGTPWYALAVIVAYVASGHRGIYYAQRIGRPKPGWARPATDRMTLADVRRARVGRRPQ